MEKHRTQVKRSDRVSLDRRNQYVRVSNGRGRAKRRVTETMIEINLRYGERIKTRTARQRRMKKVVQTKKK